MLAASAACFLVIDLVGAGHLVHRGVLPLRHARAGSHQGPGAEPPASRRTAFRQRLISNLLDPTIAPISLTLVPQSVSPGDPAAATAVLAGVFLTGAGLWWWPPSLAVGALGRVLVRRRDGAAVDRVTGGGADPRPQAGGVRCRHPLV